MQNRIEYALFYFFSLLFCLLGIRFSQRAASFLGILFYYCIPIRKAVVLYNLRLAFPAKSEKEIRKIARGNYQIFAQTFIEIFTLPALTKDKLQRLVSVKNIEFVKDKYRAGKGLIFLTAHFGNWEYGGLAFALAMNEPCSFVTKDQRNNYVSAWLQKYRGRWGVRLIPLGVSIRSIYAELKQHHIIAMAGDQRGPSEGVRVNLFNIPSASYTGPAALALKTGAPLIFGVTVKQADGTYVFDLQEVSKKNLPDDHDEAIAELSQRHTTLLEHFIRAYPTQWLWMHKRWKY